MPPPRAGVSLDDPPRLRRLLAVLALAGGLSAPGLAAGEELERTDALSLGLGVGVNAATLAVTMLALPVPDACRWCGPTAFDESLHAPWAQDRRRDAAQYSHLVSFVVLPAGALGSAMLLPLGHAHPQRHAFENAAMVTEAVLANITLTTVVKRLVARRRPAFYYERSGYAEFDLDSGEQFVSFPSGDTSIAFSAASAATTVAFLRGYPEAPYVLAVGGVLASGVAALRVAADVHWPTDVVAGAALGTLVGIGMPLLLHPRVDETDGAASTSATLTPRLSLGGSTLFYSGTF